MGPSIFNNRLMSIEGKTTEAYSLLIAPSSVYNVWKKTLNHSLDLLLIMNPVSKMVIERHNLISPSSDYSL
ncbi:hypothetical protein O6P43_005742 [Quillaja saponaria]|uniref:Uncharacterized protein n=1 Tax=Quillaja saponaria TaxID=32244 RepID=A0AAD7Q6S6_QUISA|nr:hypothetical protein O6P43_005742 [Quillaja saponaria]